MNSSDSEEELFPIVNNQAYLAYDTSVFLYDDPLLVSGILRAVVEENLDKVKSMVRLGKSVNINDNNGNTPLHVAVIKHNLEILEYLLSRDDIVVNVRNFNGETPLYQAVSNGRFESSKKLIEAGANVNLPNHEDITPLHVSVPYPHIAHLLVQHGAQINAADYSGDTPLHEAVTGSCLETVYVLLYHNADANAVGGSNLTPFMKAVITGDIPIQKVLFEYVDDFSMSADDNTCILALALTHDTPYVGDIIERGADVNYADVREDNIACAFFTCLSFPNYKNFQFIWKKICYNEKKNTINLNCFFKYLSRFDMEKYIQAIIDSDNIKPAVESLKKNAYFLFIKKFAENNLNLEQLTIFTCCLLQHGYRATGFDICEIFCHYGYCELIKLLLYMDNDYNAWHSFVYLPRLIFDLDYKLESEVKGAINIQKKDAVQILEYFIYPPLINILAFKYKDDEYITEFLANLPRVSSLIELARNRSREHILKYFNVTSTCQFYTIIDYLNVPSVCKKILKYETKLY